MKAFVVYPTYRIIDNKAYIYLFGRLENGESFLTISLFRPYFFIKKDDLEKAKKLGEFESKKTDFKTFEEEEAVKIILNIPTEVPVLRNSFEEKGIVCYEADIRFAYRFMIDNEIRGVCDINGNHKKGNFVNRIYEEPEIKACKPYDVELKTLSIDIETNGDASKLYCLSLYTKDHKESLIVSNKKIKNAVCFENEAALLQYLKDKIIEIDPDIITGWNVVDFDLNVLHKLFKKNKIPFVLGRAEWESKLRIESNFFKESSADIAGRQVLDGIALLKDSFIKLENYKLDTAAKEFLGSQKLIQFTDKKKEIDALYSKEPEKLVEYNLMDAELVYKILEKKDLINLTVQRSILTGMEMGRVSASIASFDSMYLRETRKKKLVCPTSKYDERGERIKGGFVMESKPGIYDYIIVLDFKSLYPSIIRTFNIDPWSYNKKGKIVSPNNAKFGDEEGILPMLIQHLWQMRDKAKQKKDEVTSYAIKITMNAFFGILANPVCRFYNIEIANAITSFGRQIIQDTAKLICEFGYNVIYSDTDSAFVESKTKSYDEAAKIGDKIQKFINEYYEAFVKDKYNRPCFLEIEFDKVYKRFIMPKLRGVEVGAKKRYAGLLIEDGKENVDVVGMEAVRGDWTEAAKEFQVELLNRIFHNKEVKEYVVEFVKELKKGKYDDKLIYRKSIRKELGEYIKTTPPHVKAARMLDKLESNIIEYVITENGPEPIQKLSHKLDYEHYINKQIKPIADSILLFFNTNFEDLVAGKKQKSLFDYR